MTETWKAIQGYEGFYEVSDAGSVRSVERTLLVKRLNFRRRISYPARRLKGYPDAKGYAWVFLAKNGQRERRFIHRLVCEAFHGPSEGRHALHGDGDKHNNRASNLRWGSAFDNMKDKLLHGTQPFGSRGPRAKLTEKQVDEIRASDLSQRTLASTYLVSPSLISMIQTRRRWRHHA